jgi:hypothetical protein
MKSKQIKDGTRIYIGCVNIDGEPESLTAQAHLNTTAALREAQKLRAAMRRRKQFRGRNLTYCIHEVFLNA